MNAVIRNHERNETRKAAVVSLSNESADVGGAPTDSGTPNSVIIG